MPKIRQRKRPFALPRIGNTPGTDRYEVKNLLDYRFTRDPDNTGQNIVSFLVEWTGYTKEKCTWEEANNLLDSWHLIKELLKNHGKQPQINEETRKVEVINLRLGNGKRE